MNKPRRRKLNLIIKQLKDMSSELQNISIDEFHAYMNIPDAFEPDSPKWSDELDNCEEDIGDVIIRLEEVVNTKPIK